MYINEYGNIYWFEMYYFVAAWLCKEVLSKIETIKHTFSY